MSLNDDDTWTASSTGLSTDFTSSGSLSPTSGGFTAFGYSDIADNLVAYSSAQGDQVTYTVDQVSLVAIPEPSTLFLFGGAAMGFLVYRRKTRV